MTDEVIQELWRVKDQLAKKFKHDPDALIAELRKRQKRAGRKGVCLLSGKPKLIQSRTGRGR
jgi:hypothetical protein